jgi:hypothetical protein
MACDAQQCLRFLTYGKEMNDLQVLCSSCNAKLHYVCEGVLLPQEVRDIDQDCICKRYLICPLKELLLLPRSPLLTFVFEIRSKNTKIYPLHLRKSPNLSFAASKKGK